MPPSEKIAVGGIGLGSRGFVDLRTFLEEPDVQFVAVCDVRAGRREHAKKAVDAKYGNQDCATYRDLRDLLTRPDIDAVLIATKINWHGLASILAAKAGKDVYCEKPCTKSIAESLALAETFRRTGRVFQAGTQRRSIPHFMFAVELARTQPRANADVACQTHIACHAANIAIFLGRKLKYDPDQNAFIGDDEANRHRGEALRAPWRL